MQRRDLEAATQEHTSRVAVVTASRTARGIVTAISWFNREIKAFAPAKHEDAFVYLELTPSETAKTLECVREMASRLGVVEALSLR